MRGTIRHDHGLDEDHDLFAVLFLIHTAKEVFDQRQAKHKGHANAVIAVVLGDESSEHRNAAIRNDERIGHSLFADARDDDARTDGDIFAPRVVGLTELKHDLLVVEDVWGDIELDSHWDELRRGGKTTRDTTAEAVACDGNLLADENLRLLMIQRREDRLLQGSEASSIFDGVHEDVQIPCDVSVGCDATCGCGGASYEAGGICQLGWVEEGSARVNPATSLTTTFAADVLKRI